jgi:hypothetical protein
MTEGRPDPEDFHEADYDDYGAMLDGLAEAIWKELSLVGEGAARGAAATPYIIFFWVDELDEGDRYRVRAAKGTFEDGGDNKFLQRINPDFYITSYDDELPEQIHQDLDEVMAEHFVDDTIDNDKAPGPLRG